MSTCIETGSCIYKEYVEELFSGGILQVSLPCMYTCSIFAALVPKCTLYFFYIDILFEHIFLMCKDLASLQVGDHYFTIPFSHKTVAIGCIHLEGHL